MKRSISFLLLFVLCLFTLSAFISCEKPKDYLFELSYRDGFKIMQLADIQAKDVKKTDKAFKEIDKLVEREQPDLIILTGDNLGVAKKTKVLPSLIKHMEKYKIPWAPVFGNHDGEGVISKEKIAKAFTRAKHCIFYNGEKGVDGVGNYVINLVDKNDKIAYSLFLIDSNMYDSNDGKEEDAAQTLTNKRKRSYDCIHENQIDWYERAVGRINEMNGGDSVPSLAFFHIPLFEFEEARQAYKKGKLQGFGEFRKKCALPSRDSGFFRKAKELGSTKAIVCGHDHTNCGGVLYQGIYLVYGLKSSGNSYYDKDLLGASVYTFSSGTVQTYQSCFDGRTSEKYTIVE